MIDHEAIAALVYAYAERIDAGDFAGLAQLFTHATLRTHGHPDVYHGSPAVLALYSGHIALYDGTPSTKHVTTNVVIEVDHDAATATARAYFTVLQARPELPLQAIIAGRYHDRFGRMAGVWCFTERVIFADLLGDLRFHLKQNPFEV